MSEVKGPLAGRRSLLVEDEYLIAEVMEGWLSQAGAEVLGPAPGVEQALELIEGQALDGAVLDVNLGRGRTAYPIADQLNEHGVPDLFATGDMRIIDDPRHQGYPRLNKPLARTELLRALEMLLKSRASS
jgi:CheY-like chemotaxis protein